MTASAAEIPVTFGCGGAILVGMLHRPVAPPRTGVVVVVGGPQYRVGSHRQFVLLARHLAAGGVAVLRFDCRGMGDSGGEFPGFEATGPDIAAAVDAMARLVPSVDRVVLWGLCDGAAAICLWGEQSRGIAGMALLNPWLRTDSGHARTRLKHYYLPRLFDPGFLGKVARGEFRLFPALSSLLGNLRRAISGGNTGDDCEATLPERMALGLAGYRGPVLLVLSGRDLTAREFVDVARQSPRWRGVLEHPRVTRRELPEADHTFSQRAWSEQVAAWTASWIAEHIQPRGRRP